MSTQEPFTIEQFYKFLGQQKLDGWKMPKMRKNPFAAKTPMRQLLLQDFEWINISGKGKLLTYTVINIAPAQFQALTPYAVGIVELENGLKIPGMIQGLTQEQLKIGMELTLDFGTCSTTQQWPQWQRYCFKP